MIHSFSVRKIQVIGIILLGIGLFIGLIFLLVNLFKPRVAGLFVETTPSSALFIDGLEVGRTPYRATNNPGEVTIKLIPESFGISLPSYETKVTLTPGVETVIRREFGKSEESSSGEIVSFEKIANDEVSLALISEPDSSQIVIDGRDRVFSPYKTSSISAGEHILVITGDGFLDKVVRVKTYKGFKLTAFVKLSESIRRDVEPSLTPTSAPQEMKMEGKRMVMILPTSTGFLRVRAEPSTLGTEVGQVKPGETYPLLDTDEKTGWFKIDYSTSKVEGVAKVGWISNQYAKELGDEKRSVSTPSATLVPTLIITPTP